jgi:hypothetical protein
MTITAMTLKLLGKKETVYRVFSQQGELLAVFATRAEAEAFVG